MGDGPRILRELPTAESMRLLGSVSLGRIVFTVAALPAIRPVNHVVDDGGIIIRIHEGTAIVSAASGVSDVVVAYEADTIDPADHLGWSVVVTGLARLVTDPVEIARYQASLRPRVVGQMDCFIRIHPQLVTGFRFIDGGEPDPAWAERG